MKSKQVVVALVVLAMAVVMAAAKTQMAPEEEIESLKKSIADNKADLRVLEPALRKLRSKGVKKMAPLLRPDTGFHADGVTLGAVSYSWKSKHAGKTLSGEMKANGDAKGTISGRKAR